MDTLEKRDDKQDPSWTKLNHGVTAFDMQHTSRREEEDSTRKRPAEIVVPAAPRSVNMSGHVEAESEQDGTEITRYGGKIKEKRLVAHWLSHLQGQKKFSSRFLLPARRLCGVV